MIKHFIWESKEGDKYLAILKKELKTFDQSLLGLGKIDAKDNKRFAAYCAILDLEGFTTFSDNVNATLNVPRFMEMFSDWLYKTVKEQFLRDADEHPTLPLDISLLWAQLPDFSKFLGDGMLLVWLFDREINDNYPTIGNIVVALLNITSRYTTDFLPDAKINFGNPPERLRCGCAHGDVISIGEASSRDYIGACINTASRLQKHRHFSFAILGTGLKLKECFSGESANLFVSIRDTIRGSHAKEIILVPKSEYDKLPRREAKELRP